MWKGELAGNDAGYSAMKSFVEEHAHAGRTLSIFDASTRSTIEIDCSDLSEMPKIVSYIYQRKTDEQIVYCRHEVHSRPS